MIIENGVLKNVTEKDVELLNKKPTEFWRGVTSIGEFAFCECSNLQEIVIPKSVTSIDVSAFEGCSNLKEIVIPESVTSIGENAFCECSNLKEIVIPESVTSIGKDTFRGCSNLQEIVIPESVTSIGKKAFSECSNLQEIVIPKSVTSIGEFAFRGCSNLKGIVIPESVTSIGKKAFSNCSNLQEIVIPKSVTSIGEFAFYYCLNLQEIVIPKSVTSIDVSAFEGCSNLKEIVIPESVTSIGEYAFKGCSNLQEIVIPESVTSIGELSFEGCSNLQEIVIPESVTSIGEYAFKGCSNLKEIVIPKSVTSIGKFAFRGCSNLQEIVIPESVTSIGECAFCECENLQKIVIPESVTSIGDYAFESCSNLKEIAIPESVTSIGNYAFGCCSNLKEIAIPKSVTSIGDYAFYECESVILNKQIVCGDLLGDEFFKYIKTESDIKLKQLNKIYLIAKEKGLEGGNIREFVAMCVNLGMLEPSTTKIETGNDKQGKPIMTPVSDIAYTFIQGLIKKDQINLDELHMNLQEMKVSGYNEAFMKFVVSKTNWSDIKENLNLLPRVYDWFKFRTNLNMTQPVDDELLPTDEANRFKVLVYETAENGIDRMHWQAPTMENLKKEFAEKKFSGINTQQDRIIAEEIAKYNIYGQKHYDKAKEINAEREKSGVKDILSKKVKQDRIKSLDDYRKKTKLLREQIVGDCAEILHDQIEDTSSVFTYDVLEKSSPENFAMGCLTSCCATLYGAGAGAMRAMILHPDMQPLVIRNFDNKIISFGIIYVNRKEGYAVVNDFEVNRKYGDNQKRKAIYEKAMEGVVAFVEEYNKENPSQPIRRVTCGISPNWQAINDFVKQNPKSEILKAPDFNDFKYAGSGSWPGDWHKEQYEIYNEMEGVNV